MIPSPTIVAVDDRQDHLDGIVKCLARMGHACLPVLYRAGQLYVGGDKRLAGPLSSVQLLFSDIEYVPGLPKGAPTFDMVANVLEQLIAPDNGPYAMVTWSTYPDQFKDLMEHLARELNPDLSAPAASTLLDKTQVLIGGAEGVPTFDYDALSDQITTLLGKCTEVNALMHWTDSARVAAGEVASALLSLIPRNEHFIGSDGKQLARLLTSIAIEGGGKGAGDDLTSSMNEGLGPILIDRLIHACEGHRKVTEGEWQQAIPTPGTKPRLTDAEKAQLNAMTSVSYRDLAHVLAGNRGAVSSLPSRMTLVRDFKAVFGTHPKKLIWEYLEIRGGDKEQRDVAKIDRVEQGVEWRLVGYSAACDHAQRKTPDNFKKVFLALEVQADLLEICRPLKVDSVLSLPSYSLSGTSRCLVFNWHRDTAIAGGFDGAEVLFRLREPLISALIHVFHNHGARLGYPSY